MKTLFRLFFCFSLLFISSVQSQIEAQEVFIMGTMHDVPKIVNHSYRPMLKKAIAYHPDAIYVERQRSNDSLSLVNYESKQFIPLGDKIALTFIEDSSRVETLLKTSIHKMNTNDFRYLADYFAVNRDKANYNYYVYLFKYGIKGSKKPSRNENWDLTAPLAIAMDMNFIYAMDHQHETQLYAEKSRACYKDSKKDNQLPLLIKHNKRDYRKHMLPAILGNLGLYSNKVSTIRRYEIANRMEFRATPNTSCQEAAAVWDRRNAGIAKNIGSQVIEHEHQKAIVIIGAGHVLGLRKELQKQFPHLKVIILDEKHAPQVNLNDTLAISK